MLPLPELLQRSYDQRFTHFVMAIIRSKLKYVSR